MPKIEVGHWRLLNYFLQFFPFFDNVPFIFVSAKAVATNNAISTSKDSVDLQQRTRRDLALWGKFFAFDNGKKHRRRGKISNTPCIKTRRQSPNLKTDHLKIVLTVSFTTQSSNENLQFETKKHTVNLEIFARDYFRIVCKFFKFMKMISLLRDKRRSLLISFPGLKCTVKRSHLWNVFAYEMPKWSIC